MLRKVFDAALARAFGALWFAGFLIFETVAILTFRRIGSAAAVPFVVAAIVLFVLSLWTFWRHPWALAIGWLLAAAQIPAAINCAFDLSSGASPLAAPLLAAGIDPMTGLWAHFIYSIAGSALFFWATIRFVRIRMNGAPPRGGG